MQNKNTSPTKTALFSRSRSSGALLEATNEIRRRHSHILLRAEKKDSKRKDSRFFTSNQDEETESNSEELSPTARTNVVESSSKAGSDAVMLRRRRSNFTKRRSHVVSFPASNPYRSFLSLDGSFEVVEDTVSVRSLRMRSNRTSTASINLDEKVLSEILKHNVQSRKQDEAKAAEEHKRYLRIMNMYLKYPRQSNTSQPPEDDSLSSSPPAILNTPVAAPCGISLRHEAAFQDCDDNMTSSMNRSLSSQQLVSTTPSEKGSTADCQVTSEYSNNQQQDDVSVREDEKEESYSEELKQTINNLESQISERNNEFEIDRALLDVKITAEKRCLGEEEKKCEKVKVQVIELEEDFFMKREKYNDEIEDNNAKLQEIQEKISETQSQIDKSPESLREFGEENFYKQLETYNDEMKDLEDAEFHIMETISNFDEEKEKLQKTLIFEKKKLDFKISNRKNRLKMLESQLLELEEKEKAERKRLFEERDAAIGLLQELQNNSSFDGNHRKNSALTTPYPTSSPVVIPQSYASKNRRLLSLESFLDSISDVDQSDLTRKTATPKSCQLPITQTPTNFVHLRNPRRSLNFLEENQKLALPTARYSEKIMSRRYSNEQESDQHALRRRDSKDRCSIYSTESGDAYLSKSVKEERLKLMQQRLAEAQAKKETLLHDINVARNSFCGSPIASSFDIPLTNSTGLESNNSPPKDETTVKLRSGSKGKRQTRPMSRYLPNRSSDFNLREHVEGCGHNPASCRHVVVTATSCSGYLSKKGGKIRSWKKKWFVFDRTQKKLIYFSDKREIKEKGKIPFESIQDVFFDHIKSHKSPNPSLTFCMKCCDRCHYFSAPSAEAMRIWMDVLVTGAEGYREYMKTIDQ